MNNRVVHFEIPCEDPEKTMKFFAEAFGWKFQQLGNELYWNVTTGNNLVPGIDGGIMKKRDPRQPVVNSISVSSIEDSIAKIEKAGGKIVVPKMAVPAVGWLSYFMDPDGNIHGIYQQDNNAS